MRAKGITMRQQDRIIVWPAYFDSTKTRGQGRRVPKNLTSSIPRASEINEAAGKLGYTTELVPDQGYSKIPWAKPGMVLVKKREPKDKMLKKIAEQLQKSRAAQSQTD